MTRKWTLWNVIVFGCIILFLFVGYQLLTRDSRPKRSTFQQLAEEDPEFAYLRQEEGPRGYQRYRLVCRDPLLIEDTFDNRLYSLSSKLTLKKMKPVTGVIGPILTSDLTRVRLQEYQQHLEEEGGRRWRQLEEGRSKGWKDYFDRRLDKIQGVKEAQFPDKEDPQEHWDIFDTIDLEMKETSKTPIQEGE